MENWLLNLSFEKRIERGLTEITVDVFPLPFNSTGFFICLLFVCMYVACLCVDACLYLCVHV